MCNKKVNEETSVEHNFGKTVKRDAGNVSFSNRVADKTNMGTAFPGQKTKHSIQEKK